MSKEIDGGFIGFPFPPHEEQLEIGSFTYDAKRMGGAPTISASVKYPTCLDDLWTGDEYVDFRGEKYILKQTPSSSYSNEDSRYNHEMTFVSERIILDNTYFYDVVTDPTDVDKYVSNSSKVIFFGDIHEFAKRLDYSLKYSKVGYTVVVDEGISTGGFTMSFEDQFFSQVLQSIFDIYGIPYYFVGKVIHIGYTNNAITRTFKYGVDDALLSISKTNANYKIVNRITGAGSPDNIPYYYPNPSEDRAAIEAAGGKWITPSDKLMPPIYRESLGAERFYNAENGTYKDPITGGYYIFENEYVDGNPKEHKVSFDHIKPTIKEMVNATGLRIDMFEAFDYDLNDNDETDSEGKYIHPYFFGKLRKFDGVNGFNLFDHAIEEDEMIISMTSGSCGACNFVIGVDDETQKNPVQIHTNGELLRDKDGNVIRSGRPQPAQQDTQKNSVWIALRKDTDTFGVIMPNVTNKYKPNALTDTFVILHIDLPQAYITSAENKLKEEVIKYMATNNSDKFNFSINFSRIFFAENIDILSQLNENARLQIEYNKKLYELYISSYSYKMSSNEPLPQITVELSDTLTINRGTLQTSIDSVKQDIMSSIGGNVDFLKQGLKYFVRKDVRDYAKFVEFREGIDVGGFESLISGGTFRKDIDGKSYIEVDRLYVRLKAIFDNLEIKRTTYVGGEQIASPASMKCIKVEDKEIIVDPETEEETIILWDYYRCYYLNEQEGVKIQNEFVTGDQAICKEANIASGSNVSNQYYWRLVVGVGDGYIDLSKADCDTGSTVPAAGDDIVQLGNRDDATRQKAIIQSTVSLDAPSIKLLAGINSFSLEGKAIISMGFDSLTGKATFNVYGNAYIGNPDGSSFIRYTPEGGVEINAKLSIGTTIGDGNETVIDKINQAKQDAIDASGKTLTDYAATVTKDIEGLQNQIDGAIETWFEDPVPTLTNKPAVDWNTVELKNQHLGDLYYSAEGKAYRFQMEGASYVWKLLSDSDITEALELAKKAQDTADGKRKVFVRQPLNTEDYEVGDLWVNATFSTIYSNDLLRCKTAKTVNQAFNIVHWELASKYTDDTKAEEAIKDIAGYSYIKKALGQPATEIQKGLILTSLISLGYNSARSEFSTQSGISGIYDATKPGGGIAYWSGGVMRDIAEDFPLPWDEANPPKPSDPSKYATTVIRMDGTAYYAMGNFWITNDGSVKCNPLSFFVGKDQVGEILSLFTPIRTGNPQRVVGFRQNYPFEDGTGKGKIRLGRFNLVEDDKGNLRLERIDGVPANFYTTGGMSALGLSPDIGGESGGSEYLSELKDVSLTEALVANDILMFNGTKWINIPSSSISGSSDWNDLINKPSWIGSSKPTYDFSEITGKPTTISGYGITDTLTTSASDNRYVKKSGDTMTGPLSFTALSNDAALILGTNQYIYGVNVAGGSLLHWTGNETSVGSRNGATIIRSNNSNLLHRKGGGDYAIWDSSNDGSGSGLDADLLDGYHADNFLGKAAYHYTNGVLVMTDITMNNNMVIVTIIGNPYSSISTPINTYLSFYCYAGDSNRMHTPNGVHYGHNIGEIKVFSYNDKLGIWFNGISNHSYIINAFTTNKAPYGNRVTTITNAAMPTTNLTRVTTIVPKESALITSNVTSATKLQTTRTIWGQSFNGTGNVSGAMTGVSTISASGRISTSADIYSSSWIRTGGNSGWYSETHGGGIYMTDTTYVRVSHNKRFIVENGNWDTITSYGGFATAASGGYSWANGYGAMNVGIHNNNNQTPLIVAYRIGYSGTTTGSNRLFSAELLNDGSRIRMFFGGNYRFEFDAYGNFVSQGGVTALSSASDIRLKQDLTEYSALPLINNLRSVAYKWNEVAKAKSDIFNNDEWQFGLIAQELQAMFPLFVKDVFGDYLTIDYERLIPVCWRGIQELSDISNKHESRLEKLERENRELKKEVKQLKEKCYGKD